VFRTAFGGGKSGGEIGALFKCCHGLGVVKKDPAGKEASSFEQLESFQIDGGDEIFSNKELYLRRSHKASPSLTIFQRTCKVSHG